MPIGQVYKISGVGIIITGRVMSGTLKKGMTLSVAPSHGSLELNSIEMNHKKIDVAIPGDIIGIDTIGVHEKDIKRGFVLGDAILDPPCQIKSFNAQIVIIDHPTIIYPGYTPVVHCHTAHIACKWTSFNQKINRFTGKIVEENPKFLKSGDGAHIEMTPTKPMCVETFSNYAPLGRFSVLDMKQTIAVGIVTSTTKAIGEGKLTKAAKR